MSSFLLKIIELIVAITSTVLVADEWYVGVTPSKTVVVNGTLVGYIMFSIVIIIGIVLKIPLHRTLILIITLPGAVLFLASGAIIMEAWKIYADRADKLLAASIVAFLNGFTYLVDFALTYFRYR